jgi:uncharacterized protein
MKENLKHAFLRGGRLFIGLFLYALGIVMTINANLGLGPWDVFHQGLSRTVGITMGQASITMGILIVITNYFVGEKLGWGTLCNMLFIGIFMDILMLNNIVPIYEDKILQVIMMLGGMFVIGLASSFYIGAGLGSGPRDGLMVLLTKKTGKSVRFIRNCIEITVLIAGYFLGGFVGIGTLIIALGIGYSVQFVFKLFKFDVKAVKHRYVEDDIIFIKERLAKFI